MAGNDDMVKVEACVDKLALFLFLALQGVYYLGNSIASDRRRGVFWAGYMHAYGFLLSLGRSTRRGTNMRMGL